MLPESFVNRMKEMLGEEYEAFSEALKEERHQALRVNPLKAEPEDFARTGPFSLTPVPWRKQVFIMTRRSSPGSIRFMKRAFIISRSPAPWRPLSSCRRVPGKGSLICVRRREGRAPRLQHR